MDKFLDAFYQSNLNQEDINHLKTSIGNNDIEVIIVSKKQKPRNQWIHCRILPDHYRRINTNITKLILKSQYYTHFKTRQGHSKKIID
jgi:hypothetical protein